MGRPLCDVIAAAPAMMIRLSISNIFRRVLFVPPKNDRCRVLRPRTTFLYFIYLKIGTKKSKYKKRENRFCSSRIAVRPPLDVYVYAGATSHPSSPVTWYCHVSITLYTHTDVERKRDINVPIGIPFLYSFLSCAAFSLSRRFPFRFFFFFFFPLLFLFHYYYHTWALPPPSCQLYVESGGMRNSHRFWNTTKKCPNRIVSLFFIVEPHLLFFPIFFCAIQMGDETEIVGSKRSKR